MPRVLVAAGGFALAMLACGGDTSSSPPATASNVTANAVFVRVTFVDAIVALANREHIAWDSNDVVPDNVRADVRVALIRPNPYSAVLEVLAAHDGESWGKPDPRGRVMLLAPECAPVTQLLPSVRDTYRPRWGAGVTFKRVPLDAVVRFRFVLADDDDPGPIDPIGAVDITPAHLSAALAANGAVHHANVSNQGEPILFVGLSVVRE